MGKFIVKLCWASCAVLQCGSAMAGTRYADGKGRPWERQILTESQGKGRTLLLVIDQPQDPSLLAKVVFRGSFAANEKPALRDLQQAAASLVPRPEFHLQEEPLTATNNPIWPITHAWTAQDEVDYGKWLGQIASEDFLVGGGVQVDCADYAMALRWIYSHDHQLPMGNQLAAGGQLFGSWQSTTVWDKLGTDSNWKKDERFKAALRHILSATFTHSLFTDLYAVEIDPEFVSNGTIFLTLTGDSGHTRTIFNIGPGPVCQDESECIAIVWGNEPSSEMGYISEFVPERIDSSEGGFLRFRWPELAAAGWQLRPGKDMPGFSMEQYSWDDSNYLSNVAARLNLWTSPEDRYKVSGESIFPLLMDRLTATVRGYYLCSLVPCTPQDPIYSDWSTPVRDHALANAIKGFQTAAAQLDPNSPTVIDFQKQYAFGLFAGAPFTVDDILNGNLISTFSSDPTQDFAPRWGVNLGTDARVQALSTILHSNWNWREVQVEQAQALCFPNDAAKAVCDPADPKVQKWNTTRLDQAFRLAQTEFLTLIAKATSTVQEKVKDHLRNEPTDANFCSGDGQQPCMLYDFVFGNPNPLTAMSSKPEDPVRQRYGF